MMTIEEIRVRKRNLEQKIYDLVDEFTEDTEILPIEIHLNLIPISSMGSSNTHIQTSVRVVLELL